MIAVKVLGRSTFWLESSARPFRPQQGGRETHGRRELLWRSCSVRATVSEAGSKRGRKAGRKKGLTSFDEDGEIAELVKVVQLLPKKIQKDLLSHPELPNLVEVVMDLGRIPFARFDASEMDLAKVPVSDLDLEWATAQLGEFGGDNRAGISGTLHRISCIKNRRGKVIGLTARVGRHVAGSAKIVADIIQEGKSLLVLGYPGRGKTTAIRSMCKQLADVEGKRVVIVDTSNEIAGDGDIPHRGIGRARRMQVAHPSRQHEVMIEAVENHMPQVIVIDEIGTELECTAAQTIAQRGVQLIATAHGTELENVIKNPHLQGLIGGIECVTLGDDEAKRRGVQKSILERAAPPAFDVAIEMVERDSWRIHHDLAEAVDTILAGGTAFGEIRTRTASGEIEIKKGRRPSPQELPIQPEKPLPSVPFIEGEPVLSRQLPKEAAPPAGALELKGASDDGWGSHHKGAAFLEDNAADMDWNFFNDAPSLPKSQRLLSSVVLRLFIIGVNSQQLHEILDALGLKGQIAFTPYLKKAHAVLGMKSDLKQGSWVEKAARVAGIPLFSLNSSSNMALAKAIQALLGVSPSTKSSNSPSQADQTAADKPVAEEDESPLTLTPAESAALDEVKFAIEDIILQRHQPVELMPQTPRIIQMQIETIKDYNLPWQTVGEGNRTRIRISPPERKASSET